MTSWMDATVLSVPVCGEDVDVTERFTYIGSDIHVSTCCEPEGYRRLGSSPGSHGFIGSWGVVLSVPM